MKKVGILTFHAANNFGAVLQAYSLNLNIKKLGFDSRIINLGSKKMYPIFNFKSKNMSTIARNVQNIKYYNKIKRRNNKFEKFRNDYLNIFPKEFINTEQLINISKDFYALVAGSDQIWNNNPKMKDKMDAYFINFDGPFKKISYAASFGDDAERIHKSANKIIPWIKDFDSVAVREKEGQKFLKSYDIDSVLTIDPTLLLSKQQWEQIEKKVNIKEPYILYYSVDSKKYSIEVAKKISKEMRLPVINLVLHPKSEFSGFKYLIDVAPNEFLYLIHNAKFICTNSFHGTVFSIIYEKPFVSIFNEENGKIIPDNRRTTLLKNLGLEDHMATISSNINIGKLINYDYVSAKRKLEILKKDSINYLRNSLKKEVNSQNG